MVLPLFFEGDGMASDHYAIATVAGYNALSSANKSALLAGVVESDFDSCRKSLDGTKFLIKWNSETCPCDETSLAHTDYTHAEILVEIAKAVWTSEENL